VSDLYKPLREKNMVTTVIGSPTNVQHVSSGTGSPIHKVIQKSRAKLPGWATASVTQKCDAVFLSFIEMFRENGWRYAAGGLPIDAKGLVTGSLTQQQVEAQFPGVGVSVHCGKIRDLLKLTMDFAVDVKLSYASRDLNGFFCTKKLGVPQPGISGEFKCIDRSITGNVKTDTVGYLAMAQCIFIDHMALGVAEAGKIYDPCLACTYTDIKAVVHAQMDKFQGNRDILVPTNAYMYLSTPSRPTAPIIGASRARAGAISLGGANAATGLRYLANTDRPPGFTNGYTMVAP
jgi:hypothetical protein